MTPAPLTSGTGAARAFAPDEYWSYRAKILTPDAKGKLLGTEHGGDCQCCCQNPPSSLTLTAVTAGCDCIPLGFSICLTAATPRSCDSFACGPETYSGINRWAWSGTICGVPSFAELLCCQSCLRSCWQLGGPARTFIYADPTGTGLDYSTWTCDPFFQHWDDVRWDGTPACFNGGLGTPFSVEITPGC